MEPKIMAPVVLGLRAPCALSAASALAQEKTEPAQPTPPQTPGVVSTGGVHAAVLDSEKRPITAGGFVESGLVVFQDYSERAGLTRWRHTMGTPEDTFIIETVGSGVALLDYDDDGWLDIYLVNGSTYDAISGKSSPPHAALFHNNHDGTFTDVAQQAGVSNDRWGFGVAVGDYDNDGWPDLYVTNFGEPSVSQQSRRDVYRCRGKSGRRAGQLVHRRNLRRLRSRRTIGPFRTRYVHYDMEHPPVPGSPVVAFSSCEFRGMKVMCGPRGLKGEPDHLFHNNGDGTFTDVSVKARVSDTNAYYGLTAVFADVNNDGKSTSWFPTTRRRTTCTSTKATAPSRMRATLQAMR